ncbi:MAG: OprD family outer membrane porin [Campylobacterales bacterium]|nr:OprD family outer membrane porin [Campylobacterales bacterium]
MKKTVVLSLAAVAALNASGIDEAFVAGKAEGQIRAAYVSQNNDAGTDTYGTSIGGILKYETAAWNEIKFGAAAYVSQKLGFATGDDGKTNLDLFDEEGKSYAYVGEAYLDYTRGDLNLRVGRQRIDTPFADTDDIRMHPNTFEAAIATYSGIEATTLVGGYVTRWAGYDSGDEKSTFKKLDGVDGESNGAAMIGALNESIKNLEVQGWYYGADKIADLYYADATYAIPFSETMGLELSAQYARFNEKQGSGADGSVYGIGAAFNAGPLTVGAAYNRGSNDEGKAPPIGFGGGPYMTSMEEWTIEGMEDVKAYQLSAEADLAGMGLDGVTLTALYGDFKSAPMDMHVKEIDVIAAFEISEAISGDISYAAIEDEHNNADGGDDAGYDRFLVRIGYNF